MSANHATAQHELVADDFSVNRVFFKGEKVVAGSSHRFRFAAMSRQFSVQAL
jgi:hypothetical protein